ncbi:hypothetical protein WICMUC_004000 [Wickerhamomyces mucosus]|uniref:Flavodoxin-like domain-containing protein n=1 Tax=Wickerhamomyces mucosus TaxID=1378264 RepID=A0A9P8PIG8_9ASCO|nr:hypothetical protein WICMUC_004000 [Wickerhamomyces mucosus]
MTCKIAIIYHSKYNHTKSLADSILLGINSIEGVEGKLFTSKEASNSEVLKDLTDNYIGFIFGTPTYFGSPSAGFKEFIESTSHIFTTREWANKLASGFTISASRAGSKENTLIDLTIFAAQQGLTWVPLNLPPGHGYSTTSEDNLNASGYFLGIGAQGNADQGPEGIRKSDLKSGEYLGKRFANFAKLYNPIFEQLKSLEL